MASAPLPTPLGPGPRPYRSYAPVARCHRRAPGWHLVPLLLGIVLWSSATPARAAGITDPVSFCRELRTWLASVSTATWYQETWERRGDEVQTTKGRVWWGGPDRIRIEVDAGRGAGSAALLLGRTVHGFKRGLLSFVKLRYDVRDPTVLSLRGHDMREAGFLDDMEVLLARCPERITLERLGPDHWRVRYPLDEQLEATYWIRTHPWRPYRQEIRERRSGEVVERYRYSEIRVNPPIDPERFEP